LTMADDAAGDGDAGDILYIFKTVVSRLPCGQVRSQTDETGERGTITCRPRRRLMMVPVLVLIGGRI
jgi:hypothetical protein